MIHVFSTLNCKILNLKKLEPKLYGNKAIKLAVLKCYTLQIHTATTVHVQLNKSLLPLPHGNNQIHFFYPCLDRCVPSVVLTFPNQPGQSLFVTIFDNNLEMPITHLQKN